VNADVAEQGVGQPEGGGVDGPGNDEAEHRGQSRLAGATLRVPPT
jgi:hypothetical protein